MCNVGDNIILGTLTLKILQLLFCSPKDDITVNYTESASSMMEGYKEYQQKLRDKRTRSFRLSKAHEHTLPFCGPAYKLTLKRLPEYQDSIWGVQRGPRDKRIWS